MQRIRSAQAGQGRTVPLAYAWLLMLCEFGASHTLHVNCSSNRSRLRLGWVYNRFDDGTLCARIAAARGGSIRSTSSGV